MIAAPYRNAGESLHGSPSRLVSPAGNFSAMLDFCIAPIPSKSPLKILRIPEFRVPALFLPGVRIVRWLNATNSCHRSSCLLSSTDVDRGSGLDNPPRFPVKLGIRLKTPKDEWLRRTACLRFRNERLEGLTPRRKRSGPQL